MTDKCNIFVPFYSTYGHTYLLAEAVAEGAKSVEGTKVKLARFREIPPMPGDTMFNKEKHDALYVAGQELIAHLPEADLTDLDWADGVIWGTPTRFGNMAVQMKWFIDNAVVAWKNAILEGKPTGVFTSSGTLHGGQETTILTSLVPLLHLGMVFVGTPYGENPQMMDSSKPMGGSPYGPSTIASGEPEQNVKDEEKAQAHSLGRRVALHAHALKKAQLIS